MTVESESICRTGGSRLSTIIDADRIIVMDGGRVVEVGSHAELIAKAGPYAALVADQTFTG